MYLDNYLRACAASAAAIADLSRSCARPYAAKSPFASAACPSAIACFALCSALVRSAELLDVVAVTVDPDVVPELPPNT
jgi:hypothetical protein